ncbi:hypothetical protein ACQJBY_022174 [Aegilops geniculata]
MRRHTNILPTAAHGHPRAGCALSSPLPPTLLQLATLYIFPSRRGLPTRLAAIPLLVYTTPDPLALRALAGVRRLPPSPGQPRPLDQSPAPYGGLRRRGEPGGVRGGVLVDGVPAAAGAAPQALLRLLQPRGLHHARRHRRRPRLPLRAGLGLPRLPRRLTLLAAPDEGAGCDAVVHDLRRGLLPPERRRAAGQRPAPPHQHRRPRLPEVWDGAGGVPARHGDLQPAAAPQGDAQGARRKGHRPQPPRRHPVRGDLLGGKDGLWDVRHLPHCDG